MASYPTHSSLKEWHPTLTTKTTKRRQTAGPLRGGMKDGPNMTDHMVTATMEKDKKKKILQKCGCEKVTTFRGLWIP